MCCTRLAENTGCKKLPCRHHCTTFSGHIFATKACIDNRKKLVKHQYLLHMSQQYGELRPTSGWDQLTSLGHPLQISTGFASWQRYCTTSSSGRQPDFEALNRGRHLYSAGRPSLWVLAHIMVLLSSSFSIVFSSPNLSGRRLDVCHTSTHGVALVWI